MRIGVPREIKDGERRVGMTLAAVTLPCVRRLAAGIDSALATDPGLAAGLMVRDGDIVHAGLAADAARSGAATAQAIVAGVAR